MRIRRFKQVYCALLSITFLAVVVPVYAQDAPIDIGSRLELFVDDYLIGRMIDTELVMHAPVPREVVMIHDAPWEGSGSGYHTIFRDGNIFRMYYKSWELTVTEDGLDIPHETLAAYAESRDGIHWDKPNLGLFEFNGSTDNNLVWVGPGSHDFTPFKDTNPACPPEARYKAVGSGGKAGLLAFSSPDGIHWSPLQKDAIITEGAFDSQNLAFWDEVRGEYRVYYRDFRDGSRDIKTAVSNDFVHWSEGTWLAYPGATVEQLYTNQVKPYYRAPHIFVGFPSRYVERHWDENLYRNLPEFEHRKRRANASPRYGSAITDALLMTSRDGVTFKRWGEAFLRPGLRNRDNWAYGDNYIAWHVVETASSMSGTPNELSLYATESYWTGKSSVLRRFTMRIDGFVSVHASAIGGSFETKPIIFEGDRLVLNAATSAAGYIKVEIRDSRGRTIPGKSFDDSVELFGDSLERTVTWKDGADIGNLTGKPVRLRFRMKDADLYSMRFTR